MNDDQRQFLSLLAQPPLRLTVQQAAWVLNCQPHDIPVLVRAKLLKPLGAPTANGTKYFGTREILELGQDRTWLARSTNALYEHWRHHNERKLGRAPGAFAALRREPAANAGRRRPQTHGRPPAEFHAPQP